MFTQTLKRIFNMNSKEYLHILPTGNETSILLYQLNFNILSLNFISYASTNSISRRFFSTVITKLRLNLAMLWSTIHFQAFLKHRWIQNRSVLAYMISSAINISDDSISSLNTFITYSVHGTVLWYMITENVKMRNAINFPHTSFEFSIIKIN